MENNRWQRMLVIVSLILSGEAIFTLPYHVTRFFRPTFLEVFDLSATELGVAQSAYGFAAMVAYFFGGPLADRFEPRKPLAGSLWATALGGLYLATFPSVAGVTLVWGFFGLTNILLLDESRQARRPLLMWHYPAARYRLVCSVFQISKAKPPCWHKAGMALAKPPTNAINPSRHYSTSSSKRTTPPWLTNWPSRANPCQTMSTGIHN